MNDLTIAELRSQIDESNRLLAGANKEIENLQNQAKFPGIRNQYKFYNKLLVEKHQLKKSLQKNVQDIKEYKSQLVGLQKNLEKNKYIITALIKENQTLKLKQQTHKNPTSPKKKIRGASDLRQSFGLNLKKHEKKENNNQNNLNVINEELYEDDGGPISKEQRKIEFEKLQKSKINSEQIFRQNQQKIINYSKEIGDFKIYIINYSNYINSINEQIRSFNQQIRVSVLGEAQFNFLNLTGGKLKKLTQEMEAINFIIKQLDENLHSLKVRTLKKAENIITNIQSKLEEINTNKNLTYYFLSVRMDSIINSLDDLNKIISVLQQSINSMYIQRKQIETGINSLKINMEKFLQSYQEGKKQLKDAIRKTLRKTGKNIFNSINKNLRNEKDDENNDMYDKIDEEPEGEGEEKDDVDQNLLRGSTLISINDFSKNIELFKSKILFEDKNINQENKIKEAKILRKNWHEVCYVYDDYDMHDVHFEIKAVGLGPFSFFNSCSIGFYMGKNIEILELEVNGKKQLIQMIYLIKIMKILNQLFKSVKIQ